MSITLTNQQPFATGSKRACYVHPEDDSKCIKVLLPECDERVVRRASKWYKRLYPLSHFNENSKDVKGYRVLAQRCTDAERHFPVCFGEVATDIGSGLAVELIRDADGEVSKDMAYYLQQGLTESLMGAVEEFYAFLIEHAVLVRDLHTQNLLLQQGPAGARIYMIEGFGNSDLIPLANYSKAFTRRKIHRKMARAFPQFDF